VGVGDGEHLVGPEDDPDLEGALVERRKRRYEDVVALAGKHDDGLGAQGPYALAVFRDDVEVVLLDEEDGARFETAEAEPESYHGAGLHRQDVT